MRDSTEYMVCVRKLASMRTRNGAWHSLKRKASRLRKRMIARNPSRAVIKVARKGTRAYQSLRAAASRTKTGRAVAHRFKRFWGVKEPPKITLVQGGPKRLTWIAGMGITPQVTLVSAQKGTRGHVTRRAIKGHWMIATEKSGRHIIILSHRRPVKGKFKPVGYAPETRYIPTRDLEEAGTPKAGKYWRHLHGRADSEKLKRLPHSKLVWPLVYADRNGKVAPDSNFIYDKTPSAVVDDWMYG